MKATKEMKALKGISYPKATAIIGVSGGKDFAHLIADNNVERVSIREAGQKKSVTLAFKSGNKLVVDVSDFSDDDIEKVFAKLEAKMIR